MKRKIGKEPAEYRREQDKKDGGRVIACGIPQGAGQKDGGSGASMAEVAQVRVIEWEG